MTRKDYIIATIAAVLGLVVYEVLKRTVSGDTLELVKDFSCFVGIATFTISCGIWLRKKAWREAVTCAVLVGIFTLILFGIH